MSHSRWPRPPSLESSTVNLSGSRPYVSAHEVGGFMSGVGSADSQ